MSLELELFLATPEKPMALLEDVYRAAIGMPPYPRLDHDAVLLDSMNYSSSLFKDPLCLRDLIQVFDLELGYGSSDGEYELGKVVRAYEISRAAATDDCKSSALAISRKVKNMAVVVSQGATGALHSVLSGARLKAISERSGRNELVYTTPHYALANALAERLLLIPRPVKAEFGEHLPTPKTVMAQCSVQTLACVVTLPSNPFHSFWDERFQRDYCALISQCQSMGILLIVDAVFQEMNWTNLSLVEPIAVSETSIHLCKVFSPSKDRPFAAGHRIGYALIDEAYKPFVASAQLSSGNSSPNLSVLWLAVDLMFRIALAEGGLTERHCELLSGSALLGYGRRDLSAAEFLRKLQGPFKRYSERVPKFYSDVQAGLTKLVDGIKSLEHLRVAHSPLAGNSLMLNVVNCRKELSSQQLFMEVFRNLHVCLATSECFEVSSNWPLQFRVVYAAKSTSLVMKELARIDRFLGTL